MNNEKRMPLEGIRVIELATVVAAPTTCRMLCAYGAEVIKVETSYGDEMRRAGSTELTPCTDQVNPLFTVHNSNKKLTSINIKDPQGKEAFLKLLESADVFVSNVREQSLKRLGLDYETLKPMFPGLIYAHFSGFGPKGPEANSPGFDSTAFWLRNGPMADWQEEGAFPFKPTYAFGDMATSSVLLSGILMAIIGRSVSGCGTKVETSLMASGIWCNAVGVVSTQFERKKLNPEPLRPRNPFAWCYQCSDEKWIGMYINEYGREKEKFAKMLGMEDILTDPRYETLDSLAETDAIVEAVTRVAKIFKTRSSKEWREFLVSNNVSCEVMQRTMDVSGDPQALANNYVEPVTFGDGSTVTLPCPPIFFSDYCRRDIIPTGSIGENTDEIFSSLGYSEEETAVLKAKGAIR